MLDTALTGAARWLLRLAAPLDAGGARIALFTYVCARQAGAEIQFIDTGGDAPDARASIVEDITWLGIALRGEATGRAVFLERYRTYARQLVDTGRARIENERTHLIVRAGDITLVDALRGPITFETEALGDIVLVHADGRADRTLADALDDAAVASATVIRDDRQLEGTARGLLILEALGLTPPRYAHVGPLLADTRGGELPAIAQLRRAGFLPGPVVEHLARLGWSPPEGERVVRMDELIATLRFEAMTHGPAHFNEPRLRALNARALRALPADRLAALLAAAMQRAGLLEEPIPAAARRWIDTFLAAYGTTFTTLGEALALVAGLRAEAVVVPALELERLRNRQVIFYLDAVGQYVDAQSELRDLPLDADLPVIAGEFGIAHADAFAALRMALTGTHDGPPLGLLFPLLGHDRILIRIGAISSHLLHGRGLEPIKFGPGGVPFATIQPSVPPER